MSETPELGIAVPKLCELSHSSRSAENGAKKSSHKFRNNFTINFIVEGFQFAIVYFRCSTLQLCLEPPAHSVLTLCQT